MPEDKSTVKVLKAVCHMFERLRAEHLSKGEMVEAEACKYAVDKLERTIAIVNNRIVGFAFMVAAVLACAMNVLALVLTVIRYF